MERHAVETPAGTKAFPSDAAGLPQARSSTVVEIADGQSLDLEIAPVAKRLGDTVVRMLAYNGSIPGPVIKVRQGSEIVVDVVNHGDLETTVHWHGLRLDNRYDGTHETQEPIQVGARFEYRLQFPDPGVYWYHPHIRQDYGQELGLYGNILVVPSDPEYWPPAHREVLLTLDDVLLEDGRIAPFEPQHTTYSAMGRFGNQVLVGGEPELSISARVGEVVRFYLTNTANTRVFNAAVRGARMKLVGGDSGRCEHEQLVESVILAPSERVVVDVLFDSPGQAALEHITPERVYDLGSVDVAGEPADPGPTEAFEKLRTNEDMVAERERISRHLDAEPDKTIALVVEMDFDAPEGELEYVCPMHPEVVREEPGTCALCAMKLMPTSAAAARKAAADADAPSHEHEHEHAHGHREGHDHAAGGIEWEDDMVEVNRGTTPTDTRWAIVDRDTGASGTDIDWRFRVGDQVKIRVINEMDSDHPMHHPLHIHGAGRFLVLTRDGVVEPNLVWTDTVLIPTGQVLDLLLDVTHPGRWMAHCHIAEHHESGMMFSFDVEP